MRVKNHMALWFLWFLWFLCVRYSGNPLYKPLCAFLVFVDLVWFLCGRIRGFWSRVVFGSGLRVRSCSCGFCGSVVCASTCLDSRRPMIARPLCGSCGFARKLPASCPPRCRCLLMIVSILEIVGKDINVPSSPPLC